MASSSRMPSVDPSSLLNPCQGTFLLQEAHLTHRSQPWWQSLLLGHGLYQERQGLIPVWRSWLSLKCHQSLGLCLFKAWPTTSSTVVWLTRNSLSIKNLLKPVVEYFLLRKWAMSMLWSMWNSGLCVLFNNCCCSFFFISALTQPLRTSSFLPSYEDSCPVQYMASAALIF